MKKTLTILLQCVAFAMYSQTFIGTTGAIPDNSCRNFTTTVTGIGTIGSTKSLNNIKLDITHGWDKDLDITLISPTGIRVLLTDDNGEGTDVNYTNTVFSASATISITEGVAPFTGTFKPEGNLSTLNNTNANGTWTLEVCDDYSDDIGTLNSWSINFSDQTTSTANTGPIPDNSCATFNSTISGVGVIGASKNFKDITLDITHSYDEDLVISLIAPNGTKVLLTSENGGSNNNYTNTVFSASAPLSITSGYAPFTGTYKPEGNLSNFTGLNANGIWKLEVCDISIDDIGILNSWMVSFEDINTTPSSRIPGTTGTIKDGVCNNFTSSVSGVGILDGTKAFKDVMINISHSWTSDLDISLISPNGTRVLLSDDNGGSGDDYSNTIFSATAATSILNGSAPFSGNYLPEGNLSSFNGINANGTWTLEVCDDEAIFEGTLNSWSLGFDISSGVSENTTNDTQLFNYYPNPVGNVLNFESEQTINSIIIYNNLGQVVSSETPSSSIVPLDLSNLATGIYHAKVTINENVKTVTIRKD